jgi:phosphatidate cytidylyltransferase
VPELFFRVLFAVLAIPITLFVIYAGGPFFRIFAMLLLLGGGIEFYLMTREKGRPVILPVVLMGIFYFCMRGITGADIDMGGLRTEHFEVVKGFLFPTFFVFLFIIIIIEVLRADPAAGVERAGFTLLAVFYVGFLGSYLIAITHHTVHPQMKRFGLIMLLFAVWAADTFAFFLGKRFGKRLLWPKVSPKKTLIGFMGSLLGGVAGMLVGRTLFEPAFPSLTYAVIIGLAVGIFGQAGDLFESLIKRSCGVKDSSGIFPGHGGILDRIDALLFAAPIYYYMLYVCT